MSFKFDIGQPTNNWVPVSFKSEVYSLEFIASSIPTDSIMELCNSLLLALKAHESSFLWNLEPDIYRMEISPDGQQFNVSIFGDTSNEPLFHISGDLSNTIQPLYRGLKKFMSYDVKESDWPKLNPDRIERLEKLIKSE